MTFNIHRPSDIPKTQKPSLPVDTVEKERLKTKRMTQAVLARGEKSPLIYQTPSKPKNQTAGAAPQVARDYDVADFIDNTIVSNNIIQEASDGRPFFLMKISAKTKEGQNIHIYTSAANFYGKNKEFDMTFDKKGLTWVACDILIVLDAAKKPIKICDYSEIYLDEDDISHEQESIFLINAESVPKEQEIRKLAATGYIAVMLETGHILPVNRNASKRIIDGIPAEERSRKSSLALEHLAERGNRDCFARWISMGANIEKAISYGFDPILHAMSSRNWEVFDVILSQDLGFIGHEELITYSDIAKENGNLLLADELLGKLEGMQPKA